MTYIVGQVILVSDLITNTASGAVVEDATEAVTIYKPDGTTSTPAVNHPGVDNALAYDSVVTVDQSGWWEYVFRSTTTGAGAGRGRFYVSPVP